MFKKDYKKRARKKMSVRKNIFGTEVKPRMSVYRSLNQVYVQIIDDNSKKTLVAASSLSKEISEQIGTAKSKVEKSIVVGELIGKKATEAGIKSVIFDRNGFVYRGRIKAVAEGARKAGLKI